MQELATKRATQRGQIAVLEAALAAERAALAAERDRVAALTAERDLLRTSHERLRLELELLRRRIFVAKAERVDTAQLELEFAAKLAAARPTRRRAGPAPDADAPGGEGQGGQAAPKAKRKPTGRRDLRDAPLEEVRVEIADPLVEELVAAGKAERIGHEESSKLAWKRGGLRRLVVARVKYRALDGQGEAQLETAAMPPECFPRSLAAPSLLAHVVTDKYCDGLPLYRIEDRLARDGFEVDRGTLCRWVEDAGATAGPRWWPPRARRRWRPPSASPPTRPASPVQPEPRARPAAAGVPARPLLRADR